TGGPRRYRSYQRSIEIDCGGAAMVAVPVVATLFEGANVAVEPHALVGTNDLAVYCQLAVAAPRRADVRRTVSGGEGYAIDVPSLRVDAGTMSARVKADEVLVWCGSSPAQARESVVVTVAARYCEPPPAPRAGVRMIPVSALTGIPLTCRPVHEALDS